MGTFVRAGSVLTERLLHVRHVIRVPHLHVRILSTLIFAVIIMNNARHLSQ